MGKGPITDKLWVCGAVFQCMYDEGVGERGVGAFPVKVAPDSQHGGPPNGERRRGRPAWCLASWRAGCTLN